MQDLASRSLTAQATGGSDVKGGGGGRPPACLARCQAPSEPPPSDLQCQPCSDLEVPLGKSTALFACHPGSGEELTADRPPGNQLEKGAWDRAEGRREVGMRGPLALLLHRS